MSKLLPGTFSIIFESPYIALTQMENLLHKKVLKCDIDAVRSAIVTGSNLNELDDLGESPLHWAVLGGYSDIVLLLLENGADPNLMSSAGFSPKWSAEDFGLTEIIDILSRFGGKTLTDHNFDRTCWSIFKSALGEEMPKEGDK
jgi:ankyrin repeat protein